MAAIRPKPACPKACAEIDEAACVGEMSVFDDTRVADDVERAGTPGVALDAASDEEDSAASELQSLIRLYHSIKKLACFGPLISRRWVNKSKRMLSTLMFARRADFATVVNQSV